MCNYEGHRCDFFRFITSYATLDVLFQPPNVVQMRTKSNLFELCRVQPTFVKQNNDDLILAIQSAGWNAEKMVSAKTNPQRKIPNQKRTCWSIAPMAQMLSIRCILGVKSSRSMIFMGDLWEELDKFAEYYVNVCIIGGVFGIVVLLGVQSINN